MGSLWMNGILGIVVAGDGLMDVKVTVDLLYIYIGCLKLKVFQLERWSRRRLEVFR